jgi:predicted GIY-YIG superfamily endonuclease
MMAPKADSRPVYLYRYWDEGDRCIYIGITCDLPNREWQHAKESAWWPLARAITLERHPSRTLAEASEIAAIKAERPFCNVNHNERAWRIDPDFSRQCYEMRWGWDAGHEMLGLSIRAQRRLASAGIRTREQAQAASRMSLLIIDGLGRATFDEIQRWLGRTERQPWHRTPQR